ncbi:MAG: hypothetical protein Q9Q40_00010 [Acidobacteriota bacterium]|nr:hypothetical protein [Acidobacteriota bacterium]
MGKTLATIPTGEQARFMDKQGHVGLHGINAIRLAIFIRTFGDDYGERVLRAMLESPGEAKKNLERAMFTALPRLAKLRGVIDQNGLDPSFDITWDIAAAIDVYQRLRRNGTLVSDYLAQQSLTDRELSPFQEQLLSMIDANARRGSQIGKAFDAYVNEALKQPPPGQGSLGLIGPPTKEQIWESATASVDLDEPTGALFQDSAIPPMPQKPPADGRTVEDLRAYGKPLNEWLTAVVEAGEVRFELDRSDGSGTVIVHRTIDPESEGGPWRMTWIAPDSGPTGHMVFRSYREAVREAAYEGDISQRRVARKELAQDQRPAPFLDVDAILAMGDEQAVGAIQEAIGATHGQALEAWSGATPQQRQELVEVYPSVAKPRFHFPASSWRRGGFSPR